ncbi:uncharacterized protein PAC_14990 [Phialocephala subalpina]|uniref:NAD(P)-binding domain-containing protein n=1 Tax=Phialocephala subalpina TaxID=576137 RepID=A0A1L7XJ73_9HELO|nr:uncharacterized protein PAC_14990 [Phialocephala subalpina]
MADTSDSRTIAFLGATGKTGRAILRWLLAKEAPPFGLNIYVRSRSKLLDLFPEAASYSRVKILEGFVSDTEMIRQCLSGAQTIICTLGENENKAGIRILQDAAHSILDALGELKNSGSGWRKPRLILLSSSTYNARFAAARPPLIHWLIKTAFSHPYADLAAAQSLFLESSSLLSVLLVQPPLLIEEDASGYEISTDSVRLAVSYEDLGAAIFEMIMERGYDNLNAVGVSSRKGDGFGRYGPEIFRRIFRGLLVGYVPGFWVIQQVFDRIFSGGV